MKKMKAFFCAALVAVMVASNCSVAYATENELTVVSAGNMVVEQLSEAEMEALQNEMTQTQIGAEVNQVLSANTSYTAYRYSESFNFYHNDTWVARADAECIVWHYTDGKVHLYSRTIGLERLVTYEASRTYGSIVNTDGSLSYTTGDRVTIYGDLNYWTYAIDFYATPDEQYFSCYQV